MAAQTSPRKHHQPTPTHAPPHASATATGPRRKSLTIQDPEDLMLLREKLNQIAVGMHRRGDNQIEHMEESGSDEDRESTYVSQRRRKPYEQHFRAFLPLEERPSTPPSSPQPRDVLRKQLRLKNHALYHPRSQSNSDDNGSDTASEETLDAMCVDMVEISPITDDDDHLTRHQHHPSALHRSVRLAGPEPTPRVVSTYSMLNKCPEGFRKRKSVHDQSPEHDEDNLTPLKKVSSQMNVMSLTGTGTPSWDGEVCKTAMIVDHDMDGSESPQDGPFSVC